jgi:hypothetical protein
VPVRVKPSHNKPHQTRPYRVTPNHVQSATPSLKEVCYYPWPSHVKQRQLVRRRHTLCPDTQAETWDSEAPDVSAVKPSYYEQPQSKVFQANRGHTDKQEASSTEPLHALPLLTGSRHKPS